MTPYARDATIFFDQNHLKALVIMMPFWIDNIKSFHSLNFCKIIKILAGSHQKKHRMPGVIFRIPDK
ncbi:MAG: hypothetical protein CV087_14890 [Candidatus Brocadia sp. WS118]|nr:MAG: hypothetical protein CV087_14890 [Candidatus Brocadia sp. WS118]